MSADISNTEQPSSLIEEHTPVFDGSHYSNRLRNQTSCASLAPSDSVSQSSSQPTINWSIPILNGYEPPPSSVRDRTSWVWQHGFEVLSTKRSKKGWACNYCYRNGNRGRVSQWIYLDGGSTSNIRDHLKNKHKIDKDGPIATTTPILEQLRQQASRSSQDSEIYGQLKTSFNKKAFKRKLLRWIIHDDLAFSTIASPFFREMMLEANSSLDGEGCLLSYTWVHDCIMKDFYSYQTIVIE
jgi:hypothetical protein